jgi:hypothetical protein
MAGTTTKGFRYLTSEPPLIEAEVAVLVLGNVASKI